jgi:hypothetical protein
MIQALIWCEVLYQHIGYTAYNRYVIYSYRYIHIVLWKWHTTLEVDSLVILNSCSPFMVVCHLCYIDHYKIIKIFDITWHIHDRTIYKYMWEKRICEWPKIWTLSGRLSLMRNVQLMKKKIYIFRVYHIRIIANKNWFTRHETDRFPNNHCQ